MIGFLKYSPRLDMIKYFEIFFPTLTQNIFSESMSEMIVEERSHSPGTPPPPPAPTDERFLSPTSENCPRDRDDGVEETPSKARGKKRHRRAKGKKKKQKTNLMITNEDGTNSTEASKKQKKVFLRPSKNPLLNAPKNSTQFIMDDHENSNLFWNFDTNREVSKDDVESVGEESNDAMEAAIAGGDDDSFWSAYLERDFESVYETAHQEEIYSWNRTRIIDEISTLEKRQKQLIEMLSQIDPMIYLQKLQHELLSLQEQNRQLKLVNVAERLERDRRRRGTDSPSRMPDSTTIENSDSSDDSSSSSSDEDSVGGCSSGCCLAQQEMEERLQEVAQEEEDDTQEDVVVSNEEAGDTAETVDEVSPEEGPGDVGQ